MERLQDDGMPMDQSFEGLDLLTNLTEDIPDFGGTIDPDLSDAFPGNTPSLPAPLESDYLSTAGFGASNYNDPLFPATPDANELISPQDLSMLYCTIPFIPSPN